MGDDWNNWENCGRRLLANRMTSWFDIIEEYGFATTIIIGDDWIFVSEEKSIQN